MGFHHGRMRIGEFYSAERHLSTRKAMVAAVQPVHCCIVYPGFPDFLLLRVFVSRQFDQWRVVRWERSLPMASVLLHVWFDGLNLDERGDHEGLTSNGPVLQ